MRNGFDAAEDAELRRASALSGIEYERQRKEIAARLGISLAAVDA